MSEDRRRLAHDLRNKINTLRLSASALELAEDRGESLEWLDSIILAAERSIELIDQLEQFDEGSDGRQ